jgi:hypothetical protein
MRKGVVMSTFASSAPTPEGIIANDAHAREFLSAMLGPALRRRLWAFLLTADGRQLPVVIPIDGIPASPADDDVRSIVSSLGEVLDEHAPGGSILFALERTGHGSPHGFDELWGDGLHSAANELGVDLFAVYLVHDDGVRMLKARSSSHR